MRTCTKCKTEKSEEDFSWRDKRRNKRQSHCKDCHRVHRRNFYLRDTAGALKKANDRRASIKDWLWSYKQGKSCPQCGFDNPAALQFHHRDRETKDFNLAAAAERGMSMTRILEEIAKCDLICANCHCIEHWSR